MGEVGVEWSDLFLFLRDVRLYSDVIYKFVWWRNVEGFPVNNIGSYMLWSTRIWCWMRRGWLNWIGCEKLMCLARWSCLVGDFYWMFYLLEVSFVIEVWSMFWGVPCVLYVIWRKNRWVIFFFCLKVGLLWNDVLGLLGVDFVAGSATDEEVGTGLVICFFGASFGKANWCCQTIFFRFLFGC